ncbi:MAG: FadR/GntR family transcriptional regulator [Thermovirgaceae bacterium]
MFEKLSSEKKSSNIMKQILEAIEEGRLEELDKLPNEPELAREFGVSRSVVREAMSGLVAMGVVKRIPGSGTFVQPREKSYAPMVADAASYWEHLQVSSSPDAYMARLVIEPAIWEYAAGRLEPRQMKQLKSIYKKMQQAIADNDLNGYRELDITFHLELAKASGNEVLYEILKRVVSLTGLDRWDVGKIWPMDSVSAQRSLSDHKELLALLESGTPREVRTKLENHLRAAFWEYGKKRYLQGLGR